MHVHRMGELHLEVIHDRLVRDFGLSGVTMSSVRIAYKEGVRSTAQATSEWSREIPGSGQTIASTVTLRVEPSGGQANILEFGSSMPSPEEMDNQVLDAINEGCADAWSRGPISGYGLMDVKVTVLDADLELSPINTVDAIRFATSEAVSEAVSHPDASNGIMEPVMRVEVAVSDKFVGAVLNDLTGQRRGVVLTVSGDDQPGTVAASVGRQTVEAEVPLKELVAYSTALRSLTQGGGDFTMTLERYDFALV
jgi:elongation factor G